MKFNDVSQVYRYYLEKSMIFVKPTDKILKTDVYNELNRIPIANKLKDVTVIELDEKFVSKAKSMYPGMNIIHGDIRELPFDDNFFDKVIDCSTIDHVSEYEDVLNEYKRVLKKEGKVFLVVWLSDKDKQEGNQFYFESTEFESKLTELFKVIEKEVIYSRDSNELVSYVLK